MDHIPSDAVTLADIIRFQAKNIPDKTTLILDDVSLTFRELDSNASRCANALLALGVTPDERVCFLGKNAIEYFEIMMGVSKAGAVTCPINWRLAGPEIAYIADNARASVLFIGDAFADQIPAIRAEAPDLKKIILLSEYPEWRDMHEDHDPAIARKSSDDALQLYTSGTTGRPKGVRMSNHAVLVTRKRDARPDGPIWNRWSSDDVGLIAMPCFHIGGTGFGLQILYNGATGVIMPEFDAHQILDLVDKHGVSKLFMVPAALQIVLSNPKVHEVDFSQLQYISYGASPIPVELMKQSMDVFGCEFVQKYGMTETCGTVTALAPDDHKLGGSPKMKSVGQPLQGVLVKIVGPRGDALGPNDVGEIATKSDSNMTGYWRNEEATAETITDDGWLLTGDAGYLDDDGYLFIHDRVKDMIISGGENIYPAEIEDALYSHPAVADVAVVGIPDKKWGEAVKAFIVTNNGETVTEEEIIEYSRTRIARFKCPKSVNFIDALPRNSSGKVLKKDLKAPYWRNTDSKVN